MLKLVDEGEAVRWKGLQWVYNDAAGYPSAGTSLNASNIHAQAPTPKSGAGLADWLTEPVRSAEVCGVCTGQRGAYHD